MPKATSGFGQAKANAVCLLPAATPSITVTFTIITTIGEGGRTRPVTVAATNTLISIWTRHVVVHLLDPRYECLFGYKYGCIDAEGWPAVTVSKRPDSPTRAAGLVESAIVSASKVAIAPCWAGAWLEQRPWLSIPILINCRDGWSRVQHEQRSNLACPDGPPNSTTWLTVPTACPTTQVASL